MALHNDSPKASAGPQRQAKSRSRIPAVVLAKLERAQVRTAARLWASDAYWDRVSRIRENLSGELRHRPQLQSLAKRYGKRPKQFLEEVRRLNLPSDGGEGETERALRGSKIPRTRMQVSRVIRLMEEVPEVITHPYFFTPLGADRFLELVKPLAWGLPGRHRLPFLDKAEELLASDKYRGRMHSVCKELERLARRGELDVPKEHRPIYRYTEPWECQPKLMPLEQQSERHRTASGVAARRKAARNR